MEEFVDEYLPVIIENNPQIRYFLERSHKDWNPWIIGEYEFGGDYRFGQKRQIQTRLPREQELWDTETMGHDVFKVYSKWKADPDDLDAITVETHPHFVFRKMIYINNNFFFVCK